MNHSLRATVSGSFHRHMPAIYEAVGELRARQVEVLSPSDPRVVDHIGEFLFVASDKLRSIKLVQNRHFEAIRNSDFLWIVCPDGYTGASTSAEIGAAYMAGIPVFSSSPAIDITLREYVMKVGQIDDAIQMARSVWRERGSENILIDPKSTVAESIAVMEGLGANLMKTQNNPSDEPELALSKARTYFEKILGQNK